MRKRQKMVVSTLLTSVGLVVVQVMPLEWKYVGIAVVTVLTWVLSTWSLKEGLGGVEWLMIPQPMALFTASMCLFYMLLPEGFWARAGIVVMYLVGQYALLLTGNIFSVASIRTIALFRAALAVGFVMTIVTAFLLYDTILSFRLYPWMNGILVMAVSFLLILPGLWSVKLDGTVTRMVIRYSLWLALMLGVLAVAISFWPVGITVASIFLCTMLYVFLGISQHHFSDRLFSKTVWEYVIVGSVVLLTMLVTAGL